MDNDHRRIETKQHRVRGGARCVTIGPDGCGAGLEGFSGADLAKHLPRLKSLGADVQYLAIDGASTYGHFYNAPTACHWSYTPIAQNAAIQLAQVRAIYPKIQIGTIEQYPISDKPSR